MRKWFAVAIKVAISGLLIWYLFDRVDVAKVMARARVLDTGAALLCFLVLVVQTGMITIRWWLVARMIAATLRFTAALRILLIGLFFNQTLPSSVGGDAVRVWLVSREGISLGKAFSVVLCDRVIAVVVLVAIIGVSLPPIYERLNDEMTRTALALLVAVATAGLVVFLFVGGPLTRFLLRWRVTRPLGSLASDFRHLLVQPGSTLLLVALSTGIHLLTVAAVMVLGRGLDLHINFLDSLMIVPTVVLLTTLPISVAGWGVREGAMVAGFGFLGVSADGALALSVLFGLGQVMVALPGGMIWLIHRPRGDEPPLGGVSH